MTKMEQQEKKRRARRSFTDEFRAGAVRLVLDEGKGRAWPLLTGERGHYEIAARRGGEAYAHMMERLASETGLLPEQVWDEDDEPDAFMFRGKPTGSAMPLMWAHAEYIKLLRSCFDGDVYDMIPEVRERYVHARRARKRVEPWKVDRHVRVMSAGSFLRVQGPEPFLLRWSNDAWQSQHDTPSDANRMDIDFVDVPASDELTEGQALEFTFFWLTRNEWEGQNYRVSVS